MSTTTTAGIVIALNGTDIELSPATVSDALSQGMTYSLPAPVSIGSVANLSSFLTDTFDAPALPPSSSLPSPISTVYDALTNAVLGVSKFTVNIPPSKDSNGQPISDTQRITTFTLGLSATLPANQQISLISGKLVIKGVFVTVSKT